LTKRTIIVRRLKGSSDSRYYPERDDKSDYVFVNERGQRFGRMGIGE
jgi:hypothetical protein